MSGDSQSKLNIAKKKYFELSKELIVKESLLFIDDVISSIAISKSTFYVYYPANSEEMEELKRLLAENKIVVKKEIRRKWRISENFTSQMALYRLCSTPEEHQLLNQGIVNKEKEDEKEKTIVILPEKEILKDDFDGVE